MYIKDGYQECPRCVGNGCYHCDQEGFIVRCPQCKDIDYQTEQEDQIYYCQVCNSAYDRAGELVDLDIA